MGSRLDARSNLERSLLKSCQMLRKCCQNCCPGAPLGALCGCEGLAQEALGTVCTSLLELQVVFLTIFLEKRDFEISMPFCRRIATFVRLGDQVGATWRQKSRPSGPKWLRTGKSEGPGQSSQTGRFSMTVGVMETAGNCRKPAQNQIRTEVKVYASVQPYDQIF